MLNLQYEASTRQYRVNGNVVELLALRATTNEYVFEERGRVFPKLYYVSTRAVQRLLATDNPIYSAQSML